MSIGSENKLTLESAIGKSADTSKDQNSKTSETGSLKKLKRRAVRAVKRVRRALKGEGERKFHIHLGVHKTATTYTQTAWKNNIALLSKEGILYRDLWDTRKNLTPYLREISWKKKSISSDEAKLKLTKFLESSEVKNRSKILISDENILGFIHEVVNLGGYVKVRRRAEAISDLFGENVKVFITIRNYADFFSSAYCELVTTKPFVPVENLTNGKGLTQFSWSAIYEDLVWAFGKHNVVVMDYQTLVTNFKEAMTAILGSEVDMVMPKKEVRVSPSGRAIEYIRDQQQAGSLLPLKKIVQNASSLYPRNQENPAFDPWTPEERAALDERYKKDLEYIPCWKPKRRCK